MKDALTSWYRGHVSYLTVIPILLAVAIIVASVIAGAASARNLETVQAQAVDKQLRENALLIQNNFTLYEQMVKSQVGRVNSAPLDRTSWKLFVDSYDVPKNYPAISRLAVTRILHPDEREAYLAQLSEQYGQPITLSGDIPEGQDINMLAYLSPEQASTVNNVGYNIWSDPKRKRATQLATDSDKVVMTEQVELVRDAKIQAMSDWRAFLMYAPYYQPGMALNTVEERRAAVQGHVFASFKTEEVFAQIFDRIDRRHVTIKVSTTEGQKDEKRNVVVYSSQASNSSGSVISRHQDVETYGQKFAIHYDFDRNFLVSTTQLQAPLYTVLFGSMMGLLIGTLTFLFLRGRHHEVLLDKEREITRAKDELLSLASHQLRTPATGVKQYMGMVLQGFVGPITDAQEEMLTKAYRSNERQLRVINDILHLAKLDLGRIVLAKTRFNFAELVNDVIEEQQQELKAADLKLTTHVPKKAPLYADPHMLRMVVENLLSNAIKYTDPGGRISVRLQSGDGGYYVTVRDTGVGIANEDLPQLFKQFSRIRNPRSHLVTGTGVGLYLAKHLAQLHKGGIVVESQVGKGSSFVVFIPKDNESL